MSHDVNHACMDLIALTSFIVKAVSIEYSSCSDRKGVNLFCHSNAPSVKKLQWTSSLNFAGRFDAIILGLCRCWKILSIFRITSIAKGDEKMSYRGCIVLIHKGNDLLKVISSHVFTKLLVFTLVDTDIFLIVALDKIRENLEKLIRVASMPSQLIGQTIANFVDTLTLAFQSLRNDC